MNRYFTPAGLLGVLMSAGAAGGTFTFNFGDLDAPIPDGSSSGVTVTRAVSLPAAPIVKVSVFLGILPRDGSAMFNGDLYVGLAYGSEYAVLLNRVGRRAGSSLGYGDSGFEVWLDDEAPQGDVHAYRFELSGSHAPGALPPGVPLTGNWAPDGRLVNPATVLLTDSSDAKLDTFNGLDGSGDWTLFVADWETGGLAKLDRWSLQITVVPEPALLGAVTGLGLLSLGLLRRWRASPSQGKRPVPSGPAHGR